MGGLTISHKILDKYIGYLKYFYNKEKKNLIVKLSESIETKPKKEFDLKSIFGAWVDNRTSDEIIADIRTSRVEKVNTEILK